MVFNSFSFLVFFIIVFALYWRVPKRFQWLYLLLTSYYFYASWKPAYVLLILLTTVVSYVAARYMEKLPQRKTVLLLFSLLVNIGILFAFKYFNLFSHTTNLALSFFNTSFQLPQFSLLLPVGISFYTFQTVGYLMDVHRGKIPAEKHFGIFALFVSFFPQLLAGPIERGGNTIPQFHEKHSFDYDRTVSGLKLFTLGLFKKVVIADNLGVAVDKVFSTLPDYKGLSLVLAVFLFSWQIYSDFSGYTDMARGVARMLGIKLMENFNTPYLATSIRDFWRRWHISLSSWFRDYLYIPLGGNRKGLIRTCLNTLIVFLVCGLWHGSTVNFALWGLFSGVFISTEIIALKVFKDKLHIPHFIAVLYTYVTICVSWVLFRAATLTDVVYIYRYSFAGLKNFISPTYIWATLSQIFKTNVVEMVIVLFCLVAIMILDLISSKTSLSGLVRKQHPLVRWFIYVGVVSLIVLLRNADIKEFIYIQF